MRAADNTGFFGVLFPTSIRAGSGFDASGLTAALFTRLVLLLIDR
jgi:hypothetical protein